MSGKFYQYPDPLEGPNVPYKNEAVSNPALRGKLLQIGASIVSSSGIVQSILYRNNGFQHLRSLKHLSSYEPRYDPTVIPTAAETSASSSSSEVPALPNPGERRPRHYYTTADYHDLYKSGELTPSDVVEALLPLIRRDTTPAGEHSIAFINSKVEIARAAAEASTARYRDGKELGPLDGVPVAIKDEADVEGYKRTLGTKMDFTDKQNRTAWCVKRWMDAGAVIIGKATMHELGLDTSGNNPNTGTPRNPHNSDYYTGGSSAGSAYALGAGIVPIAFGADGGGSIRLPASFCGVYGLKPSHGRVSGKQSVGLTVSCGVAGPMAASLEDLALAYRIMASPDPANPASASFPDPLTCIPGPNSSAPKTIGVYRDWIKRADPAVLTLFDKTIEYYRDQKFYTIVDISIPYLPEGQKAHALTILTDICSTVTKEQISQATPSNRILLSMAGNQAAAQDFIAAQRMRNLLMRHLAHLYQKYPGLIIATPTVPIAGWKIAKGEADLAEGVSEPDTTLRTMEYVYLANFTGCPALSWPMGYATNGGQMPVGIMGMGEWGSEESLIAWARDGEGILDVVEGSRPLTTEDDTVKDTEEPSAAAPKDGKTGPRIPSGKGAKWVDVVALAREYRANLDQGLLPSLGLTPPISI